MSNTSEFIKKLPGIPECQRIFKEDIAEIGYPV